MGLGLGPMQRTGQCVGICLRGNCRWLGVAARGTGSQFEKLHPQRLSPDAAMMVLMAKLPSKLLPLASVYRPTAQVQAANDAVMVWGYKHMTCTSRHAHTDVLWGPWVADHCRGRGVRVAMVVMRIRMVEVMVGYSLGCREVPSNGPNWGGTAK